MRQRVTSWVWQIVLEHLRKALMISQHSTIKIYICYLLLSVLQNILDTVQTSHIIFNTKITMAPSVDKG